MAKYDVIDLFAGCGGFSVGFENANFNIVKAVEIDNQIAETYKYNHTNTQLFANDIGEIDSEQYFHKNESDVIIGGPPCQGFSMAGARIRHNTFLDDPRNYLFKHYVNVVRIVRPKIFLFENVKGILTMRGGKIFDEIIKTFSDETLFDGDKYNLHYKVVKAVEFGIPQKRERVVLIGMLNRDFDIDELFDKTKAQLQKEKPHFFDSVNVWQAISDLGNPTECGEIRVGKSISNFQETLHNGTGVTYNHIKTRHSAKATHRMEQIEGGENYTKLDEPIHSVHSGSYGRLEKDKPAATITTRFDTPSGGRFTHPEENRTITPREAARIQSFPDSFKFYGTKSSICKQIGNAVPPKLSFFLAKLVKFALYNE